MHYLCAMLESGFARGFALKSDDSRKVVPVFIFNVSDFNADARYCGQLEVGDHINSLAETLLNIRCYNDAKIIFVAKDEQSFPEDVVDLRNLESNYPDSIKLSLGDDPAVIANDVYSFVAGGASAATSSIPRGVSAAVSGSSSFVGAGCPTGGSGVISSVQAPARRAPVVSCSTSSASFGSNPAQCVTNELCLQLAESHRTYLKATHVNSKKIPVGEGNLADHSALTSGEKCLVLFTPEEITSGDIYIKLRDIFSAIKNGTRLEDGNYGTPVIILNDSHIGLGTLEGSRIVNGVSDLLCRFGQELSCGGQSSQVKIVVVSSKSHQMNSRYKTQLENLKKVYAERIMYIYALSKTIATEKVKKFVLMEL